MNRLQTGADSDLWLNEALSESSAIVVSEGHLPGHRMDGYNVSWRNSIMKGNYFYHWNNDDSVLADYSTAALFMYWLYLNGGGEVILENIAQSNVRGDYRSVVEAAGKTTGTLFSLNSWEGILLEWLEANENYTTGYPDGKYIRTGYDENDESGPIELESKIYSGDSTSVDLFPGDAVLSTNITTGDDPNTVRSNFNSGEIHITLNKNTNVSGSSIRVQVPAATAPSTARMSDFPVLVGAEYRIQHIPQRPLPEEVYE